MAKKRWSKLSPRTHRFIMVGGGIEGSLKLAALRDLARRPADEVRGPKALWAVALVLVNSVGVAPITYLLLGRRKRQS